MAIVRRTVEYIIVMFLLLSKSPLSHVTAFRSSASALSSLAARKKEARTTSTSSTLVLSAMNIGNLLEGLQRTFSSVAATNPLNSKNINNNNNNKQFYTIGITGAGGLVGTALRDELSRRDSVNGKPVRIVRLARGDQAEAMIVGRTTTPTTTTTTTTTQVETAVSPSKKDITLLWNPNGSSADETIHPSVVQELDTIVHLSGENVATGQGPFGFLGIRPWTLAKKADILNSRVQLTRALAQVVADDASRNHQRQKSINLLTASGVGVYGSDFIDNTKEAVDESFDTTNTLGFLANVSRAWEGATVKADQAGCRVVKMRFGVVLSTKGGALAKLYPIFLLGGGGIVGSGQQYWSFISARDIARAMVHTMETPTLTGPVNLCSPQPCSGVDFTKALGKALNRPTLLPFPSFAVSLLFGEMGEEMLLGGVRSIPTKLLNSGFQFLHPTIDEAIASAIEDTI